jgi:hypothetical protein
MATKDECSKFWGNKLMNEGFISLPSELRDKIKDPVVLKKMADADAEYSQKCGKYDEKQLKCISINSKLQSLIQLQGASASSYFDNKRNQYESTEAIDRTRKEFNDNDCTKVIEQYRQQELGDVANKFSTLDKARIEEESKYVRNQRIFFGALILLGGVVMITMFGKNKKL